MQKHKAKGFTLIEIMIVLSIISILTLMIVPNISAYIRNSKIRTANNNAEIVYRAAQDWLVEQEIDFIDLFPSSTNPSKGYIRSTKKNLQLDGEVDSDGSGVLFDVEQYFGSEISTDGYWRVVINPEDYECLYVIWSEQNSNDTISSNNDLFFNDSTEQMEYVKENGIIGIYPYKKDI